MNRGDAVQRPDEPAHRVVRVGFGGRDGRVLQLGDSCRGENAVSAVPAVVHLRDDVVTLVFSAGDEVAGGEDAAVVGEVDRSWTAEPVAVAGSQAVRLRVRLG